MPCNRFGMTDIILAFIHGNTCGGYVRQKSKATVFSDFSTEEPDLLTEQALDLFDRCLTEGDPEPITAFIQRQVIVEPPDLDLFRRLVDALQQRILSLRTSLYTLREEVLAVFKGNFDIDLSSSIPIDNSGNYSLMTPDQFLMQVLDKLADTTPEQAKALLELGMNAIESYDRLQEDIELAVDLQEMILDWLEVLATVESRRSIALAIHTRGLLLN